MISSKRRVVITGLGAISPLGLTVDSLWQSLTDGRSGVGPITCLPTDALPIRYAGQADEFKGKIADFGDLDKQLKKTIRKSLRLMCRECQMGVAAAQYALADAGISDETIDPSRIGLSFNSDYMITLPDDLQDGIRNCKNAETGQFDYDRWGRDGMSQMNPLWQLKYLPNMPAAHIAIFNNLQGPNNSVTVREAGAGSALGEAFHIIASGRADAMLTGGTGTRLHPIKMIHAIQHEQLVRDECEPETASRPFDHDRLGMVPGEGAGSLLIEELEHAQQRGATIHAELLGGGYTASIGPNMTARRREAIAGSMRAAMKTAGLTPSDIGHISAHGLATPTCDVEESAAIRDVLADLTDRTPVTAPKSFFGNLGGGSGIVELIAGIESLKHDRLIPVMNYKTPDDECRLNIVRESGQPSGDTLLQIGVSPQGQAGVVAVRRWNA